LINSIAQSENGQNDFDKFWKHLIDLRVKNR